MNDDEGLAVRSAQPQNPLIGDGPAEGAGAASSGQDSGPWARLLVEYIDTLTEPPTADGR
ncbi:hypothetical protein ACIRYZ_32085 [Kitasatospora sp. NPDC101155]|jgi:hypothetical protein|uniref:hypothetical protein n=1 Tax=Kitasatospora sp. NPDC101155 TaxID=3364097 RepID=UPI0038023F2A